MNKPLTGKIALVTGGSRSLGRGAALKLAGLGANVVITYVNNRDAAEATTREIAALGVKAAMIQVDLTGTAGIDAFVTQLQSVLSKWNVRSFDILINNAGILCKTPFPHVQEAELDAQFETNFKSVFFLTQKLAPLMNDGGRIMFLGSGTTHHAFPPLIAYATIKAAVETFARYMAKVLGERGITVNSVSPGAIDTDFNAEIFGAQPGIKDYIGQQTALGRVGVTDDVSGVIGFLATEEGRWVTGQRVEVSGGFAL